MSEVATCPRCDGERVVYDARSGGKRDCPTCRGEGVVWHRAAEEAGADSPVEDPLDLTFRS